MEEDEGGLAVPLLLAPEEEPGGHQAEGGEERRSEPCAVRGRRAFKGLSGHLLAGCCIEACSESPNVRVGMPGPSLVEGSIATEDQGLEDDDAEVVFAAALAFAGEARGETGSPGLRPDASSGFNDAFLVL